MRANATGQSAVLNALIIEETPSSSMPGSPVTRSPIRRSRFDSVPGGFYETSGESCEKHENSKNHKNVVYGYVHASLSLDSAMEEEERELCAYSWQNAEDEGAEHVIGHLREDEQETIGAPNAVAKGQGSSAGTEPPSEADHGQSSTVSQDTPIGGGLEVVVAGTPAPTSATSNVEESEQGSGQGVGEGEGEELQERMYTQWQGI